VPGGAIAFVLLPELRPKLVFGSDAYAHKFASILRDYLPIFVANIETARLIHRLCPLFNFFDSAIRFTVCNLKNLFGSENQDERSWITAWIMTATAWFPVHDITRDWPCSMAALALRSRNVRACYAVLRLVACLMSVLVVLCRLLHRVVTDTFGYLGLVWQESACRAHAEKACLAPCPEILFLPSR